MKHIKPISTAPGLLVCLEPGRVYSGTTLLFVGINRALIKLRQIIQPTWLEGC